MRSFSEILCSREKLERLTRSRVLIFSKYPPFFTVEILFQSRNFSRARLFQIRAFFLSRQPNYSRASAEGEEVARENRREVARENCREVARENQTIAFGRQRQRQ